jgi:hypothetical protein
VTLTVDEATSTAALWMEGAEAIDDAITVEGSVSRVRISRHGVNVAEHDQSASVATQIADCSVPKIIQVSGNHMLLMPLEWAQGSLKVFVLLLIIRPFTVPGDAIPSKLVYVGKSTLRFVDRT